MNAAVNDIAVPETGPTTGRTIITFPRGLLGFEECREFRLERNPEWEPFAKLEAGDRSRLSFVIASPRVFLADFTVRIDPLEVAELEIRDPDQIELWTIVTIPDDPRQMSVNLQGPIIINRANGKGKQVVLTRSHYSTRHPIFAPEPVAVA